jgi:aminoglycoside 6'-N-acetyltransferase
MHDAFLTLEPFTPAHVALLERWLDQGHVKAWFPDTDSVIARASNPPQDSGQAVIYYRRLPLGYLRWQRVDEQTLRDIGLTDVPAGSVDIDIFIGEDSQRGQGIGPMALKVLCKRLAYRGDVPLAGLTTSVDNQSAHRAFEKAGFVQTATYTPPGFGPSCLFTRKPTDEAE